MMTKIFATILLLIVLFLSCGCNLDHESQAQVEIKPKPPAPAPDPPSPPSPQKKNVLYIKTDKEYNEILDEIKKDGNHVVLYFWADWCPPCKEISRKGTIKKLGEKFKEKNVFFLKIQDTCTRTFSIFKVSVLPTMLIGSEKLTGSNGITVDNVSLVLNNKLREIESGNSKRSN